MRKLNTDRISTMTDDEITSHLSRIKNLLSYKNNRGNKTNLEIERCYLQREFNIRVSRKRAHEDYLRRTTRRSVG